MNSRIAVMMTAGYLDSVPSLRDGLQLLAECGVQVDIFCPVEPRYHQPLQKSKLGQLIKLPLRKSSGRLGWLNNFLSCLRFVLTQVKKRKYACIIGVDPEGLILATAAGSRLGIPVVYYSLEILCLSDKSNSALRVLKLLEMSCHKRAQFTVIQDSDRATLLQRENGLKSMPYVDVPNGARGKAGIVRSEFLRRQLSLSHEHVIILHAGSIAPWTLALEAAEASRSWPDNWALVFQCRHTPDDEYGKRLLGLVDNKKVFLRQKPVPSDRFHELIASADIGLALYQTRENDFTLGKNLQYVGKSSGKIAQYLQCGVPVLASDIPSIRSYLLRYPGGGCVAKVSDIESGVQKILGGYSEYSRGAVMCFEAEFSLEDYFAEVRRRLMDIIQAPKSR